MTSPSLTEPPEKKGAKETTNLLCMLHAGPANNSVDRAIISRETSPQLILRQEKIKASQEMAKAVL